MSCIFTLSHILVVEYVIIVYKYIVNLEFQSFQIVYTFKCLTAPGYIFNICIKIKYKCYKLNLLILILIRIIIIFFKIFKK